MSEMRADEIYARIGVPPVINAAGKLTALGGTAQTAEVAAAQAAAAQAHVDLAALRAAAGGRIAELSGAEAASVVPGAAAGIAVSVAACVAGSDAERVALLPDAGGAANGVVLQAGHKINFGAPVAQMVRMGGGETVVVGSQERTTEAALAAVLGADGVAALLFVQSHHTTQEGTVPLDRCVALAHDAGVPVIVDAAAEEDLRRYIDLGADLVTYSGGKAFGGPTVGFIAGRADLVAACEAQQRGIARTMKVGKESIAGLLRALDQYAERDEALEQERRQEVLALIEGALSRLEGVEVFRRGDEAGRPIERVGVRAVEGSSFDLGALVEFLESGSPSIRTRNHGLSRGYILFDPREVSIEGAEAVARRLGEFVG